MDQKLMAVSLRGEKQQLKKHWILWFVVQTTNFVSNVFNKSSLLVVIIAFMLDLVSLTRSVHYSKKRSCDRASAWIG